MSTFLIMGTYKVAEPDERLYNFLFEQNPVPDLTARDDGVIGNQKWVAGDRIAYHTAYVFFAHEDPGHHDYLNAIRVVFQNYGVSHQINDKGMVELIPDGLAPYPYEKEATLPVDRTRPGGVIEIYHDRDPEVGISYAQLLGKFTIPPVSNENPKMKWYYQLGGLFVGEHDDLGTMARIIVSAMHPRYSFRIAGVETGGLRVRGD